MIHYDEGKWFFSALFHIRGSLFPRALLFSVPSSFLTWLLVVVGEETRHQWADAIFVQGFAEIAGSSSQLYTATTAGLMLLLGFRTNQAMSRFWEGTGLLHQMRGEWFDTVGCLVTFSRSALAEKPLEVANFRHCLIRLMSLCHGSALEELKADDESDHFDVLDIKGLDRQTLEYLDECRKKLSFNRVDVLLHMIQVLIMDNVKIGVLSVAPPILSRVFQTLSRGHVNLLNATKIQNTLFPFPYAQLISGLIFLHCIWTPFMIASIISLPWLAVLVAWIPLFGSLALNFSAIELENPFGNDHNDLPLTDFQLEMNRALMMLLNPRADHVPRASRACEMTYEALFKNEHERFRSRSQTASLSRSTSMFEDAVAAAGKTPLNIKIVNFEPQRRISQLQSNLKPTKIMNNIRTSVAFNDVPQEHQEDAIETALRTRIRTEDVSELFTDDPLSEESRKTPSIVRIGSEETVEVQQIDDSCDTSPQGGRRSGVRSAGNFLLPHLRLGGKSKSPPRPSQDPISVALTSAQRGAASPRADAISSHMSSKTTNSQQADSQPADDFISDPTQGTMLSEKSIDSEEKLTTLRHSEEQPERANSSPLQFKAPSRTEDDAQLSDPIPKLMGIQRVF